MTQEKVHRGVRRVCDRTTAPGIIENKGIKVVQNKKMDRVREIGTRRYFESHEFQNVTDFLNQRTVGERTAGTTTIESTLGTKKKDMEENPKEKKNKYETGRKPGTVRERKKYTEEKKKIFSRQMRFPTKMYIEKKDGKKRRMRSSERRDKVHTQKKK